MPLGGEEELAKLARSPGQVEGSGSRVGNPAWAGCGQRGPSSAGGHLPAARGCSACRIPSPRPTSEPTVQQQPRLRQQSLA